jgi:hypothetical protein
MPSKQPRHSITETTRVREALEPLRQAGIEIDFAELIVLGAANRLRELEAAEMAEEMDDERKAALRQRLVERLHTGKGIDIEALYQVRRAYEIHRPGHAQ